ncbi:hypothetical protein AFL01nite_02300 [Aeromicrobium flavum]|uniref:Cache domain-containing protein n=1 Tax=Aeromicrobium flavum TaxID=416568 RepID=A0A512HR22_9ACTN|nr:cache domain-containing protein [Aeromicrobium flavum]GEO87903.1 hypothetical protein AFL01nite_02300 [Aeromicrobium flavum]
MTAAIPATGDDLARDTSAALEPVFARLELLAERIRATHRPGAWSESDLMEAQSSILEQLTADPMQVGIGFVSAPGLVDGLDRYMLWWQQHDGRTSRLRLNFDRTSIDVYDYVEMEWFEFPAGGRTRATYGPYVDYSGSELYIVTVSVPVTIDGEFVGIVGADVLFEEVERRILAVLRHSAREAVVVTADRRVVAANSGRWVQGSRLPAIPADGSAVEGGTVLSSAELPLGNGWVLILTDVPRNGI